MAASISNVGTVKVVKVKPSRDDNWQPEKRPMGYGRQDCSAEHGIATTTNRLARGDDDGRKNLRHLGFSQLRSIRRLA